MYFLARLVCCIHLFCELTLCFQTHIQINSLENEIIVLCTVSKLIKSLRILPLRLRCPWSRGNQNEYCYENCSPTCLFYGECKILAKCSKEEIYGNEGSNNDEFDVKYKFVFQNKMNKELLGSFSCRYASQEVFSIAESMENGLNFSSNTTRNVSSNQYFERKKISENSFPISNRNNETIVPVANSTMEKLIFIVTFFAVFIATCITLFIIIRCVIQKHYSSETTCSKIFCIKNDPTRISRDIIILANKHNSGIGNYPNMDMDNLISVPINTPPMLGAVNVLERKHSDNLKRRYNRESMKPSQASIHEYVSYGHQDLPPIPNVHGREKLSDIELTSFQNHSLQYIPVSASRYQSLLAMEQQFIGAVNNRNGYFTPQPSRSSKSRIESSHRIGSHSNLRSSLQNNLSSKIHSGQCLQNKVVEISSCSDNEEV